MINAIELCEKFCMKSDDEGSTQEDSLGIGLKIISEYTLDYRCTFYTQTSIYRILLSKGLEEGNANIQKMKVYVLFMDIQRTRKESETSPAFAMNDHWTHYPSKLTRKTDSAFKKKEAAQQLLTLEKCFLL